MVVSVGSLNYFDIVKFIEIIQKLLSLANKTLVFEVNLQCPDGAGGNGIYNPSIDTVFRILYDYVLTDGKSDVDVQLFKKYTSIWTVNKNG
jgi:hypothetical protein